jgi:hypothetical protein
MVNRLKYFIFLFLVLTNSFLLAQSVEVKLYSDSTKYYVGDYISLNLAIKHPKDYKIVLPNLKDSLKDAEFIKLSKTEPKEIPAGVLSKYTFTISKYDSGSIKIKPLKIELIDKANNIKAYYTDSLSVNVTTMQVDNKKDISDIKAPIKIGINWLFVFIVTLIIILILSAIYLGYSYYRKKQLLKQGIIVEKRIPPYEIAKNALKYLEEQKLWQKGEIKQYHTEITYIVRKYLEDEFNFNALEKTSEEIIENLQKINSPVSILDNLKEFFENADMVKFAKFSPMPIINEKMFVQANTLVDDFNSFRPIKIDEISEGEVKNV